MISDRIDVLIAEMRGSQEIAESTGHFPYKSAQWWAGELTEIKAALEARNAGLEKDAARLDWIESLGGTCISRRFRKWYCGPGSGDSSPNLRAAIDAAIERESKP